MAFADIYHTLNVMTPERRKNREMLALLFKDHFEPLWKNTIIYHERKTVIVTIDDLDISPGGLRAKAKAHDVIIHAQYRPNLGIQPYDQWSFGTNWYFGINLISMWAPYANWSIWPDPALVQEVVQLHNEGYPELIRPLLWPEDTEASKSVSISRWR
jgi:hypothetical protein